MSALGWLIFGNVIWLGIVAWAGPGAVLVRVPAARRAGTMAYAGSFRGQHVSTEPMILPALDLLATLFAVGTAIWAYIQQSPGEVLTPLSVAAVMTAAHSLCATKAAPIMLSLHRTENSPQETLGELDRFAFWHSSCTVVQLSALIAFAWAVLQVVQP